MKSKAPSNRDHKHENRKTPGVKRWAKRKNEERADNINRAADDLAIHGSRYREFMAVSHLAKVKSDKARAERKLLATTSLKDLIK